MTNSINIEGVQVATTDLQSLSAQWSLLLSGIDYPSQEIALQLIESIAFIYLRGRGCKMGNKQSREYHKRKLYLLIQAIYSISAEQISLPENSKDNFETTLLKLESGRRS